MSPCSMSVDRPHTPAVRWKRQLHRGASETPPRSTGLENTSVATGPSQQSLRGSVLSIISQDPGTSVLDYLIGLPVRHSCKAEPWHRASPEGHSAAHPMAPSGGPARRQPRGGRPGARGPEPCSLCRIREQCHLAYNQLTHIQRLLVWKPAPLQSSTTQANSRPPQERACMSHQKECSLLQPRSAPRETSLWVTPEPALRTLSSCLRTAAPALLPQQRRGVSQTTPLS